MFFTKVWFLGTALTAVSLTGCERTAVAAPAAPVVPATSEALQSTEVTMRDMQFSPATVKISIGGTVEWKNDDLIPHTVTSPVFGDSGALASGQTWRHTFKDAGEFPYVCTFHPTMKGTVIVK